ncbi:ADP-forming succinate--CoA ligase subunit beta [Bifidobacterium sp.]|jgi:succinyl-CoA synthetase beta subunit|uniref:ADP-forming succinate--CoA ligase subunit beta n=1 Tax=Bifidobacterium sp. TaxID=41200 RepID=UPI0025BBEE46|nr:ADP-forming succinate--CoA ligase subunit beta [Bifidobacterium sp.]MCI1635737.1 ADP-forming succinate--CoA ligase subunit beta [Bifidobacterium sp.]
MDLYEYQARELLEEQGIAVPRAIFAQNSHEVAAAADEIGYPCVIKAQVKTGHRGQAGGIKLAANRDDAILTSEQILPMSIHGHKCSGVLVTEAKNILHEYYVSISVDRASRDFDVLATAHGGTEVETIAKQHPEAVKRLHIGALEDFDLAAATEMAKSIGFYHADVHQAANILLNMWRVFKENDATLVEINPLAKVGDPDDEASKSLSALDAKISLDDNAAFRHNGWIRFADPVQTDPYEQQAREHGLHYVHLNGEVGVIGNGAGLVMSSLDAVSGAGEEQGTGIKPANFLDIGGGATAEVMSRSLSIVLSDPQVASVLVNIYGGITRCDVVAEGILEALKTINSAKAIVIRFDGNAAAEGLATIDAAHNPRLHVAPTMEDAAQLAASLASQLSAVSLGVLPERSVSVETSQEGR